MTKNEFMTRLTNELKKRNVADAADVTAEYEQHFAFKLADGYSEEEIAARLGDPAALAAQFGETDAPKQGSGSRPLVVAGLCFADVFAGLFFVLLAAWELVMAAASVSFAALAVCLLGGLNVYALIPAMPYCAARFWRSPRLRWPCWPAPAASIMPRSCASSSAPLRASSITRWLPPPAGLCFPRCRSARGFPPERSAACVPWHWSRWRCLRPALCLLMLFAPCLPEACSSGMCGAGF